MDVGDFDRSGNLCLEPCDFEGEPRMVKSRGKALERIAIFLIGAVFKKGETRWGVRQTASRLWHKSVTLTTGRVNRLGDWTVGQSEWEARSRNQGSEGGQSRKEIPPFS